MCNKDELKIDDEEEKDESGQLRIQMPHSVPKTGVTKKLKLKGLGDKMLS